jgi:hypothetical protein
MDRNPEDRDTILLRNLSNHLHDDTVSQPIRWELKICC